MHSANGHCSVARNDAVFEDDDPASAGFIGAVDNLFGCCGVFCSYEDEDLCHGEVVLSDRVGSTSDTTGR